MGETDVQFDKTEICVWLDEEAAKAMTATATDINAETAMVLDGAEEGEELGAGKKRTGWFCHVRKWRFVETSE